VFDLEFADLAVVAAAVTAALGLIGPEPLAIFIMNAVVGNPDDLRSDNGERVFLLAVRATDDNA
jgi:hypothetical protein